MIELVTWLGFAALATTDLCADPVPAHDRDGLYCRLPKSRGIQTPYFTLKVAADFYVKLEDEGRQLHILAGTSASLSQAQMTVRFVPEAHQAREQRRWRSRCPDLPLTDGTRAHCDTSRPGVTSHAIIAREAPHLVIIEYQAPDSATVVLRDFRVFAKSVAAGRPR